MSDPSIAKLPTELEKLGIDGDVGGKIRTRKRSLKPKSRFISHEEFINLGNTFRISHQHVEHENLLPGFTNLMLFKNSN